MLRVYLVFHTIVPLIDLNKTNSDTRSKYSPNFDSKHSVTEHVRYSNGEYYIKFLKLNSHMIELVIILNFVHTQSIYKVLITSTLCVSNASSLFD